MNQYHILVDQEQYGPYSEQQLKTMYASGSITADAHYWTEGMEGWCSVSELSPATPPAIVATPPPTVAAPIKEKPKGDFISKVVKGLVILIGVCFVFTIVTSIIISSQGSSKPSGPEQSTSRMAYHYATVIIKKRMKAPSQTTFSNVITDSSVVHYQQRNDGLYDVGGWMDSPNGFGVMLRVEWRMMLEYKDSTYYPVWFKVGDETGGELPPDEVTPR